MVPGTPLLFTTLCAAGDRRWSRSCWVLEILENILRTDKNKNERDAGDWLPLLRTLFVLLRKVASIESEDTSYKMSLILNVLKHLMTNVSDSKLQKIDQSQVTNLKIFSIKKNYFKYVEMF